MLFIYIIVREIFSLGENKSLLSTPYFNNILEERVNKCFLKGELDGKGVMNFMNYWREGSWFFIDRNYKIYFAALHKNATL